VGRPAVGSQFGAVALLAEPARRAVYRYVAEQPREVGREEAARAVGIDRSLAAFHLDKLTESGLLEVSYRRLSGRSGPGAGRPAKVYRRAEREFDVTVPPRDYALLARLMAEALIASRADAPLRRVARSFGRALGASARDAAGSRPSARRLRNAMERVLLEHGFQPFQGVDGAVRLRNCPFHALSRQYQDSVCGMNLELIRGLLRGLGAPGLTARLERPPGLCCVVIHGAGIRRGSASRRRA